MAHERSWRLIKSSEHLNIVIVGHVDHGKSTLLGRLYADTGSLPDGKLEKVQAICRQQGKEFEYAFLFDAFLEEQEQGITIDTARTFFTWKGRQYIIIDAPGHKEFLKNMISGRGTGGGGVAADRCARGRQGAVQKARLPLVPLGRPPGCGRRQQDGPRRIPSGCLRGHRKGISRVSRAVRCGPERIIPVSAKLGDNIANRSQHDDLVSGPHGTGYPQPVQEGDGAIEQPLRFPVQDVYKFDARRIIAGRITAGRLKIGDHLVFSPSNKRANIRTIEAFNIEPVLTAAEAGQSVGITLDEQILSSAAKLPRIRSGCRSYRRPLRPTSFGWENAAGRRPQVPPPRGHKGSRVRGGGDPSDHRYHGL